MSLFQNWKNAAQLGEEIGREMVREDLEMIEAGTLRNLAESNGINLDPVTHEILHVMIDRGIKREERGK